MTTEIVLGPAMLALTEKQRRFVLAMASDPCGNATQWARDAGYEDNQTGAIRVIGHELIHSPKIEAAVLEVGKSMLGAVGPVLAAHGLIQMAKKPNHPQHVRAIEAIANRVGMSEKQEIEVTHRDLTGDALLARLTSVAQRLGLDAQKLIGVNVAKEIEGEAVEVGSGTSPITE